MIFYFTGTGNSLYAAGKIAEAQGERLVSIAALMNRREEVYSYELAEGELLGFVFPVYAWAPPKIVLEFIKKLKITYGAEKPYVFSLCTCGDEEGHTSKIIRKALAAKGFPLHSAFSIQMPNNYVLGFDVDPAPVEEEKLRASVLLLEEINKVIERRKTGVDLTIPGSFPVVKSVLINSLFNRFALNTGSFFANDSCTGCGICEKICPVQTIRVEGKPIWGKECTQCMGCLHRCPERAIQYGKGTARKGRYHHPDLDRLEKLYAPPRP